MGLKKHADLLHPAAASVIDLRANVAFKPGQVADEIRKLAQDYQLEPAAIIRMLVVEGLKARKERRGP